MKRSGKYSCSCCGEGVGVNSLPCTNCNMWSQKRCSGVRSLRKAENDFQCQKYKRVENDQRRKESMLEINGGNLKL